MNVWLDDSAGSVIGQYRGWLAFGVEHFFSAGLVDIFGKVDIDHKSCSQALYAREQLGVGNLGGASRQHQ